MNAMIRAAVVLLAALAVCQGLPHRLQNGGEKIVGGYEVSISDYPYQISMMVLGSHSCGGSIASATFILTAAHCINDLDFPSEASVRAGSTSNLQGGQVLTVVAAVMHPKYDATTSSYDAGLLTLEGSGLDLTAPNVRPTRLVAPNAVPRAGQRLIVSGWGTLHSGDYDLPEHLMAVSVPVQSHAVCKLVYSTRDWLVDETMICAGFPDKDSCQGDSGGPLVDDTQAQVGIVSWGIGCGEPGYPGVYANVAHPEINSWIVTTAGLSSNI